MAERLAGQPTRANFRTGTLTVCTMVPMRSVPHRVVCLLGLDDGVFPRAPAVDGDDVLARTPLTGERDLRSEDRQLLLDAILATRERLVVTYSGANETTGQRRPPAVPLGELLDALDDTAGGGARPRAASSTRSSPSTRATSSRPCRSPSTVPRSRAPGPPPATGSRSPSLATADLPPQPPADLELASLVRFFLHPVRAFLRDRLGVALLDEGEEVADGLPVELDNLEQWGGGRPAAARPAPRPHPDQALGTEWRRGVLPPGPARLARSGSGSPTDAAPVAEMVESVTQGQQPRAVDVDVDLGGGRRLRGTVTGLYGDRVVIATFSRLGPRQRLEAWVPLLALCATRPRPLLVRGRDRPRREGSPRRARRAVARVAFARVDDAGRRAARPGGDVRRRHARAAAAAAARPATPGPAAPARGNDVAVAPRRRVQVAPERFPGENDDAAHVAGVGTGGTARRPAGATRARARSVDGEDTRLGALALRLWQPMLAAEAADDDRPWSPSTSRAALPTGTTLLEASAGTGKTCTVGALVTRYVAEGVATPRRRCW